MRIELVPVSVVVVDASTTSVPPHPRAVNPSTVAVLGSICHQPVTSWWLAPGGATTSVRCRRFLPNIAGVITRAQGRAERIATPVSSPHAVCAYLQSLTDQFLGHLTN